MTEANKVVEKIKVSIRVEFIHRPNKRRLFNKKYPFLIQNEPFEYGIRVTNIGQEYFSGALVDEFAIEIANADIHFIVTKKLKIRPLNPGEKHELYLDKHTLLHEGPLNLICKLIPENDNEVLNTFQYNKDHEIDEIYGKHNEWWDAYFCQGQQQLLQTTTNNLILLLTIIIVIETIFGLKDVLQLILQTIAYAFSKLSSFFSMLAM